MSTMSMADPESGEISTNWWAKAKERVLEQRIIEQATEISSLRMKLERLDAEVQYAHKSWAPSQPPALLPRAPLSVVEQTIDERIRTLCQTVCAIAVVYFALYSLSHVLVLFFLAVALKYLLTPLIDFLSCQHPLCQRHQRRCFRLPRQWAVFFALVTVVVAMTMLSLIVANSLSAFASKAGVYNARIEASGPTDDVISDPASQREAFRDTSKASP